MAKTTTTTCNPTKGGCNRILYASDVDSDGLGVCCSKQKPAKAEGEKK